MSPRSWIETIGTALLIGAVLWGIHSMRGTAAAVARAEVATEERREAEAWAEEAGRAMRSHDLQARIERAEMERARDSLETRVREVAARRPAVATRIVEIAIETAGDSTAVRAAVDSLEAEHEREVVAYRSIIAVQDSVIRVQAEQIETRDRVNASLRVALKAAITEADAWKKAQPGWLERNALPVVITAAVGVGVLALVR